MLFDEPWPADDTAKSTSLSLPSRMSSLRLSLGTLLGKDSSTVSRACLSRQLSALPDAMLELLNGLVECVSNSDIQQESRNLGQEWYFERPLLMFLPFRHRSRHRARQTGTDCFILKLLESQHKRRMYAAGLSILLASLCTACI